MNKALTPPARLRLLMLSEQNEPPRELQEKVYRWEFRTEPREKKYVCIV